MTEKILPNIVKNTSVQNTDNLVQATMSSISIIASPSVVSHMASPVVLSLVVLSHSGKGEGVDSSFATRSINKVVFILSTAISV